MAGIFSSIWQSWRQSFRRNNPHLSKRPRAKLACEVLENRAVPSAGVPDPTFDGGGMVFTNFPSSNMDSAGTPNSVAIQPDGKIIVAADNKTIGGAGAVRYNGNGTLDTSFGPNHDGFVLIPSLIPALDGFSCNFDSVAVLPDGKILLAGTAVSASSPGYEFDERDFALVRLNCDGSLDASFGDSHDGVQLINFNSATGVTVASLSGMAIEPGDNSTDYKIVLDGSADGLGINPVFPYMFSPWGSAAVARLNSDGSLDTCFNGTGKLLLSGYYDVTGIALQSDNILINTLADGGIKTFSGTTVIRVTNAGAADPTFVDCGMFFDTAFAVKPDGSIILAGWDGTGGQIAVQHLDMNGCLDNSFNQSGQTIIDFNSYFGNQDPVFADADDVAIQADGKIVVACDTGHINYISAAVRLNSDGSLDSSYGSDVKQIIDFGGGTDSNGPGNFFASVAIQPDGKAVFAGTASNLTGYSILTARYLSSALYNAELTSALFGSNPLVAGTLIGQANTTFTVDVVASPDGSNQDEYDLGTTTVATDANGNGSFAANFSAANIPGSVLPAGWYISATATDSDGNTSQFCADVQAADSATIQATPDTASALVSAIEAVTVPQNTTVSVSLNLASGMYSGQSVSVPTGMTLYINGAASNQLPTTVDPATPAFTIVSGNVVVSNVTFVTTGDAPTILVQGGSLTLRNDTVQESTGFPNAAISIIGGTVDLGTATDSGGNTFNVNGSGTFIRNTAANPIIPVGDTFEWNGQATAWPVPLTITTTNSLMLAGNAAPPLTGSINGTSFAGAITYTTAYGDQLTVTLSTTATAVSPVGQYAITAALSGADGGNYIINPVTSQVGTMYVVSVGADPSSTAGAKSVVFWDNKGNSKLITSADVSAADALNLVTQGGAAFDPKSVQQLQSWLSISPNATTAYQLAVQLAVMDLNVLSGYVKPTDLVYAGALLPYASPYGITSLTSGGFMTVQSLMNAANSVLGTVNPGTPSGDPYQAYEAALMQILQGANLNCDFVQQELLWNLVGL